MAIEPGQLWEPDIGTFVCFLIECSVYCCIKRVADPLVNECTSCFLKIYCHTTGITLMRENVYNLEFSNFPESGDFLITGMCTKCVSAKRDLTHVCFKILDIFIRSMKCPLHIASYALKIGHGVVRL